MGHGFQRFGKGPVFHLYKNENSFPAGHIHRYRRFSMKYYAFLICDKLFQNQGLNPGSMNFKVW